MDSPSSRSNTIPCRKNPTILRLSYNGGSSARLSRSGGTHAASLLPMQLEFLAQPRAGRLRLADDEGQGWQSLRRPLNPMPDGEQSPTSATGEGRPPPSLTPQDLSVRQRPRGTYVTAGPRESRSTRI